MSWDDEYDDLPGRRSSAPSRREVLVQAAGYVGLVVAVVALVVGAIFAVTVIGSTTEPEGFAAPSAHGQGLAVPPVSTPLDGGESADEADANESTDVSGSAVAPLTEPDVEVVADWVARIASATGIPERALSAYALAHVSIAETDSECGLDWTTIAAIGAVETGHGSHGDSVLHDSGLVQPTILGPALDGDGMAAIHDTDDGVMDGDAEWDRAVGPMQFIPSTWETWGIDANGDGVADPNHIDDAAHSAAAYLCASGPMTSPEGWREAVFSYNHDDDYVDKVATIANGYAAAVVG